MPVYVYASREDHIVPWRSAYRTTALVGGDVTFVLGASGHIAGVVNPPQPVKRNYWTNELITDDPDDWFARRGCDPGQLVAALGPVARRGTRGAASGAEGARERAVPAARTGARPLRARERLTSSQGNAHSYLSSASAGIRSTASVMMVSTPNCASSRTRAGSFGV